MDKKCIQELKEFLPEDAGSPRLTLVSAGDNYYFFFVARLYVAGHILVCHFRSQTIWLRPFSLVPFIFRYCQALI